jgi:hypothetical protein
MTSELHIMLDLETLSTRANAIILEVGYAIFETGGEWIQESGCWKLNWGMQVGARHLNQETFDWWMRQSDEAFKGAFAGDERTSPIAFINEFGLNGRIPWHNLTGVWSHGAGFDIPILDDLHTQHGHRVPWHYRTPRDTRTLFWLADMSQADMFPPTLKHSAEADAVAQAVSVQRALKKLNWG